MLFLFSKKTSLLKTKPVSPGYNRPSTNKLRHFVNNKKKLYNSGCNKAGKRSLCKRQHFSMLCLWKNEIKSGHKYYLLLLHLPFKSSPNKLSGTGFVFVLALNKKK